MLPESPRQRRTVLVVEDDVDTRAILRLALEDEGFTVESAGDGLHALQRVRDRTPDVVILDLGLPRMRGEEFLYAWRANVDAPGVPVIVISATYQPSTADGLGVDAFLAKPFELPALVRHVKRLVEAAPGASLVASRDARVAELREVADDLAGVMSTALMSAELLADAANVAGDLRPVAATALKSAQSGATLVRRLHQLVESLE